jgi:alkaline phosphatase
MTARTTGHKSCVNALGVYCGRNRNTPEHPRVETIAEIAKRLRDLAVGVVTNTEDATLLALSPTRAGAPIMTISSRCSSPCSRT